MQNITERKQERAEKEAALKAQEATFKKKRKVKKGKVKTDTANIEDASNAVLPDEPLDEEGLQRKDAVLEALQ